MAGTRPAEGVHPISASEITGSRHSEMASSPHNAEQLVTNLNHLAKDIHCGNLPAFPKDYVTLSQGALNSSVSGRAPSSATAIPTSLFLDIASSSSGASALVNELNRLSADFAGNALNSVSVALTAASVMSLGATVDSSPTEPVISVAAAQLIQETLRVIVAADASGVNTDLAQLASLLSEIRRINYGEQDTDADAFASGTSSQLTETTDEDRPSLSPYDLSLLAWHLFGSVPPNSEQYGDRETRKKLRRITSRRFAEERWSVIVFLAGFQEPDDLKEALEYVFSEEALRDFARRLMREADPAYTPDWQRKLIDEVATRGELNQNPS